MGALDDYRKEIDDIDRELIGLFEKRMNVVLNVAKYKKDNKLEVLQKGRETEVIKKAIDALNDKDYSDEAVRFMNATMEISRGLQKRKIQDGKKLKDINVEREPFNPTKCCSILMHSSPRI